jgi:stage II sporulation protein D
VILQPTDPAHRVLHDGRQYRGEFLILPSPKSPGLTLVNNLDLEDYLRGVVPWEIGRHGEDKLAALAAQAVAARTYTISHLGARSEHGFDVFATVMDQVYQGAKDEDELCNQAIDRTRGLVLRSGGEEIEAYYSACCGGVSSNIHEVWPLGDKPYLTSHADAVRGSRPFCADYRYYDWREEWTVSQLEAILARTLPEYLDYMGEGSRAAWAGPRFRPARRGDNGAVPGRLKDLEILEKTTSGRVAKLALRTEAGEYLVRGDRVRWVLAPASGNPAILRSARFEVELTYRDGGLAEIAARGKGYGHGIGLCQSGALEMARQGHDYRSILEHYYRGAVLQKVGSGR